MHYCENVSVAINENYVNVDTVVLVLGNLNKPCVNENLLESIYVIAINSVSYGFIMYPFAPSIVSLWIKSSCSVLNKYVTPFYYKIKNY